MNARIADRYVNDLKDVRRTSGCAVRMTAGESARGLLRRIDSLQGEIALFINGELLAAVSGSGSTHILWDHHRENYQGVMHLS